MLGCAKYAASRGSEVHAVLGFRDAEHKMLTEDFAECCRSLNVISDDGSTGRRGFVTELVEEFLESRVCEGCSACDPGSACLRAQVHAPGGGGGLRPVRCTLPGLPGGEDGLRRGSMSGLCLQDQRRTQKACVQGRSRIPRRGGGLE